MVNHLYAFGCISGEGVAGRKIGGTYLNAANDPNFAVFVFEVRSLFDMEFEVGGYGSGFVAAAGGA